MKNNRIWYQRIGNKTSFSFNESFNSISYVQKWTRKKQHQFGNLDANIGSEMNPKHKRLFNLSPSKREGDPKQVDKTTRI